MNNFYDLQLDISSFDIPVCIIGDMNARTGVLNDLFDHKEYVSGYFGLDEIDVDCCQEQLVKNNVALVRNSKDKKSNNSGKLLCETCVVHNICILNGRFGQDKQGDFTCFNHNLGKSVIDYAIVSPKLLDHVADFKVNEFDKLLSDTHCAITLDLKSINRIENAEEKLIENEGLRDDTNNNRQSNPVYYLKWGKNMPENFKKEFNENDVEELNHLLNRTCDDPTQNNINEFYKNLSDIIVEKAVNVEAYVPSNDRNIGKTNKFQQPCFNKKCLHARDNYYKVRNRLKFTNIEERNRKVKAASMKFKDTIKETKKQYFKRIHSKLRVLKSNNSKEYWNFLNKSARKTKNNCEIELETLREHFEKISQKNDQNDNNVEPDIPIFTGSDNDEINQSFTINEIKTLIRKLKNGKSCGLDRIRNEFLKNCPDEILNVIVRYFNIVLESGIVPEDWCVGVIIPLYKNKGNIKDPDNYRGITLLSCVGKLFTALLNQRLTDYMDAVGGIGDEQAGFRHGYSTMDHIFTLYSILQVYMNKGKRVYCAFIDYKKAFDFVDRVSLWKKMLSIGINGKLLNVIHSLYNSAKSCVRNCDVVSDYFSCNVGVRQGENLSPMLFAIFLNDFEFSISRHYRGLDLLANEINEKLSNDDVEHFLRIFALLYADDTIVLAESPEQLQLALNAVYEYCRDWNLTVNTTKTKIVIFSRYKVSDYPAFLFGHDLIEVVDDYTYLGVIFNYNGSFQKAINKQALQGKKAFYALLNKVKVLRLPVDLALELFDHLVIPILLYGSEVWGFSNYTQLEILERKFIKVILGLNKSTPNCMIYGETGKIPISNAVNCRMINFYARIVNGNHHKIAYIMYKLLKKKCEQEDNFSVDWVNHVQVSLGNIGMNDLFMFDGNGFSCDYIKKAVKLRIADMYKQDWHNELYVHEYCDFYKTIKTDWHQMKYLTCLNYYQRKTLCKWRCRSNQLPISTSRFNITDEILCPFCIKDELVGDELHYLFKCPFFNDDRSKFLGNVSTNQDIYRVIELFQIHDINLIEGLLNFINLVMKIFENKNQWDKDISFNSSIYDENEEI